MAVNPTLCLLTLLYPNPQLPEEAAAAPSEEKTKGEKAATVSLSRTCAALIDCTRQSGPPYNSEHRRY